MRPFTSNFVQKNKCSVGASSLQSRVYNGRLTTLNGYSIRTDSELDDKVLTDEICEINHSPEFKFLLVWGEINQWEL